MVHKEQLGKDIRGNFRRSLGFRADGQKQTFYLGSDQAEATRRNALLEVLWAEQGGKWTEAGLEQAKSIARGQVGIAVAPSEATIRALDSLADAIRARDWKQVRALLDLLGDW